MRFHLLVFSTPEHQFRVFFADADSAPVPESVHLDIHLESFTIRM